MPDEPEDFPPYYFGPPPTTPPPAPPPTYQPVPTDPMQAPYPAQTPYPTQVPSPAHTPYPRYGVPDVIGTPGRLRANRIWATLTQLTILVDVILHGVYIHEVAREHTLLRRIQVDPQSVTLDEANAADNATRAAAIWLIVVLILGGIFLIVWLYRLRTDAEVFDPDRNHLSRGWAIGGWFVPIANLVLPFLVMRDVIRSVRAYPDGSTREAALLPLTCVWWGLWVVGAIGARLVHLNTNGTIGQLNSTLHEVIVLVLVEAVAGVVALAVIEAFTRANRRRWAAQPPEYGGWVAR